jgi:hypothetical protein
MEFEGVKSSKQEKNEKETYSMVNSISTKKVGKPPNII